MTEFSSMLTIGDVRVGPGIAPFVIAEIGSNHDGSLDQALRLIEAAAGAGAQAVKFQSFTQDTLVSPIAERLRGAFTPHELPDDWLPVLAECARVNEIAFMSTPFDLRSVDRLNEIGVPAFKIASGDLTNHLLLEAVAATGKPIVISSGAAYLGDIETSLGVLSTAGATDVVVLHCVSSYPPSFADLNLKAMRTIAQAFEVLVGFSDHTPGTAASVAAVARGAVVIEKHLTFDRGSVGPDHPYALTVPEFTELVTSVRQTSEALGSARKAPSSDGDERYWAWRGLYAARAIPVGAVVTREDLVALRPREGIGADCLHEVLDKRALESIAKGEPIRSRLLSD